MKGNGFSLNDHGWKGVDQNPPSFQAAIRTSPEIWRERKGGQTRWGNRKVLCLRAFPEFDTMSFCSWCLRYWCLTTNFTHFGHNAVRNPELVLS